MYYLKKRSKGFQMQRWLNIMEADLKKRSKSIMLKYSKFLGQLS